MIKKLKPMEYVLYASVIALGIALDQLTKLLSVKFLAPVSTVPLIQDVLHLTYVENRGAAFGMLSNSRWVFLVVSSVAIVGLCLYLFFGQAPDRLSAVSLAIILSGGIGNMIDRIGQGYVVDFIDFRLIHFAVFNGADSFVCVGAGLLVLAIIRQMIAEKKNEKKQGKAV